MWRTCIVVYFVINFLCVNSQSACTTPNGERARCVSIYDCRKFLDVLDSETVDQSQYKFIQDSSCNSPPSVCCGSDTRYKPTTSNLLPDRSSCGTQDVFRIIGGEDTDINEFPWLALLEATKNAGGKSFDCGGALISSRYVLTAAHCIVSTTSKVTSVRLGEWNLDTTQDCIVLQATGRRLCSPPPQDIAVERTVAHEGYGRDRQGAAFHDIGLVRLARAAAIDEFVKPICLPLPNEVSSGGDGLLVAGWGQTKDKKYSPVKQKLIVPIIAPSSCKATFGQFGVVISDKQLCAGGEEGRDSCRGDSGGPLMANAKNDTSIFYIEGVVSYGRICAMKGWPGVYTRVSQYLDWIRQNVKP